MKLQPKDLRIYFILGLLSLSLVSCTDKVKEKQQKISLVSTQAIQRHSFSDKLEECYRDKMRSVEEKAINEVTDDDIKKAKLKLVLNVLNTFQNTVSSFGVPLVSPGINLTIDKTVQTYYVLEKLNKSLERKTGMSVEVEEDRAGVEFSKSF